METSAPGILIPADAARAFTGAFDVPLAATVARRLTCTEADALAGVLTALGAPASAAAWSTHHAMGHRPHCQHPLGADPADALKSAIRREGAARRETNASVALLLCALIAHLVRRSHPDARSVALLGTYGEGDVLTCAGTWRGADGHDQPLDTDLAHEITGCSEELDEQNDFAWLPLCLDVIPVEEHVYRLDLDRALAALAKTQERPQ